MVATMAMAVARKDTRAAEGMALSSSKPSQNSELPRSCSKYC